MCLTNKGDNRRGSLGHTAGGAQNDSCGVDRQIQDHRRIVCASPKTATTTTADHWCIPRQSFRTIHVLLWTDRHKIKNVKLCASPKKGRQPPRSSARRGSRTERFMSCGPKVVRSQRFAVMPGTDDVLIIGRPMLKHLGIDVYTGTWGRVLARTAKFISRDSARATPR